MVNMPVWLLILCILPWCIIGFAIVFDVTIIVVDKIREHRTLKKYKNNCPYKIEKDEEDERNIQ